MMNVLYVNRSRKSNGISIERLFSTVRDHMSDEVTSGVWHAPHRGAGLRSIISNLLSVRSLRKHPGVLHVTGDVHYLLIPLWGRRTVLTIHDCVGYKNLNGWKRWVYHNLWFKWPIKAARVVTTISDVTKQDILSHVPSCATKIRVIPNCVFSGFTYSPKDFNETCPIILQVGTGWNKNLERVAQALQEVPCHFRIIGVLSKSQESALAKLDIDYSVTGRISDDRVREEYMACDMVVFASLFEGFGLPILEAQATGRPVVTSDLSSMPEAGGDGCCYVNPNDIISIREGLHKVIDDKTYRESLITKGLDNVSKYSPDAIAGLYQNLYKELSDLQ